MGYPKGFTWHDNRKSNGFMRLRYFVPRLSFANELIAVELVIGTRPMAGRCSNPNGCEGRPNGRRITLIHARRIQSDPRSQDQAGFLK